MNAEGWFVDPFGAHGERWFSDGRPTNLVRNDGVESRDDPPAPTYAGPLERVETPQSANGSDLRRADEAEGDAYDEGRAFDAVMDAFAQTQPPT